MGEVILLVILLVVFLLAAVCGISVGSRIHVNHPPTTPKKKIKPAPQGVCKVKED